MNPDLIDPDAAVMERHLLSDVLSDRVEMVIRPLGPNSYRVAGRDGWLHFERVAAPGPSEPTDPSDPPGQETGYDYRVVASGGVDPIARRDTDAVFGHGLERSASVAERDAYPHAYDSIAQLFDSPVAPDLVATHTAAHAEGGNLGQHGSLATLQARAPFLAAGAGIVEHGAIDVSARMVDVAPTIAALLGLEPHPRGVGANGLSRCDATLLRQDGDAIAAVLDGSTADHVQVILLDGCNANLLYDVIDSGEAPNLAGLAERGTRLEHGIYASLPTATLANHTAAITGAHPGHSGVLHHTWWDRRSDTAPQLLSMEEMFWASDHLAQDVETIFEAIHRAEPDAFCSATFEFCDRGADFSSFALVREGSGEGLPELDDVTHVDRTHAEASAAYEFMSRVDHLSVEHSIACWERRHGNALPVLSWCSLSLTDEAGHESGPHGELARAAVRDSDARVGELLAAIDAAGVRESTAVLVIADHGMEQADPAVDRPWQDDLTDCPVPHRIDGEMLVYLTER